MEKTQEALINGVEMAIDYGLEVSEADYQEYIRAKAYQKGRVDARRETMEGDMRRRQEQIDKLKRKAAGLAIIVILLGACIAVKDASLLIVFGPPVLCETVKGD